MVIERDAVVGVVVLIRHAQKVGKTVGSILHVVTVFFVNDDLIDICIKVKFLQIQKGEVGSSG